MMAVGRNAPLFSFLTLPPPRVAPRTRAQADNNVVLTATVTDSSNSPVSNALVSFYRVEAGDVKKAGSGVGVKNDTSLGIATTGADGVATLTIIAVGSVGEVFTVYAAVDFNGVSFESDLTEDTFTIEEVNNVDIQLASGLAQPQPANTVQRVTATIQATGNLLKFVIFTVTNLEGLDLVRVSCQQPDTREQAPVKAGFINLCPTPSQQRRVPVTDGDILAQVLPDTRTAWIELTRSTPGDTSVSVDGDEDAPYTSLNITGSPVPLVWSQPPPIPAKVLIGPKKAYRRCYESAEVVAHVLDAGGAPVADQPVTFGVTGSCVPRLESTVVVTDAHGYAHLRLTSSEPGVAVVVAATVGANGNAVLSRPSHIVFKEEHQYEDREYEGRVSAQARGAARPDSRWVMMVAEAVGGLFDQDACSLCGTLDDACWSALPACPPTRSCCCAAAVTQKMSSTDSMQRTQPAWL
jgi:hypothetical protein